MTNGICHEEYCESVCEESKNNSSEMTLTDRIFIDGVVLFSIAVCALSIYGVVMTAQYGIFNSWFYIPTI